MGELRLFLIYSFVSVLRALHFLIPLFSYLSYTFLCWFFFFIFVAAFCFNQVASLFSLVYKLYTIKYTLLRCRAP